MAQPKEVHCPFCHHKEMFDGPVGSTVRCRNCKSIFRMPAEGVKRGEKVKKYSVRRHSPAYYVVLVILIGGAAFGWKKVSDYFKARQQRLADIWVKLDDPFPKAQYALDKYPVIGTVERFMECWKLADERISEDSDYTGYECMLLYITDEDIEAHEGDLQEVLKEARERLGHITINSYTLPKGGKQTDPNTWKLDVNLSGKTAEGFDWRGYITLTTIYEANPRLSQALHEKKYADDPDKEEKEVEEVKSWGVCLRKAKPYHEQ